MTKPNILIFMTDQQRACSVLPDDPYKAITPVLDEFRQSSGISGIGSVHACPHEEAGGDGRTHVRCPVHVCS